MALPLAELVATTDAVGATRARKEKVALLAELLQRAEADEVEIAVGLLAGDPRQGRIGVGWATVAGLNVEPATTPHHGIRDLDALLTAVAATHGAGSKARREELLRTFLGGATGAEVDFVRRLLVGELRQGANAGIATDAVAKATDVPAALLRRAVMLTGDLRVAARVAATEGRVGLEAVGLQVGRPVLPMLASTSESVASAAEELGFPVAVEWKLDGIRIQVHKDGDDVQVWTRGLNEITGGLPQVVETVRQFPAEQLVLDGEVLGINEDGTPVAFQDSVSNEAAVRPYFFDLIHIDGLDLLDTPLAERRARLAAVAGDTHVPGAIVNDTEAAEAVQRDALALRHEGVMVKAANSPYQAGRRGKTWRKVKPVHTLDLVVLAVEHGSGRRTGWLSNIHLGARAPDGGFVMVGKTFKGMSDEMLRWQTERFKELAIDDDGWVVNVRPEQVVEIAIDGIQRSTRYPGGVALRFARVLRYRDDKVAGETNTIDDVRSVGSA